MFRASSGFDSPYPNEALHLVYFTFGSTLNFIVLWKNAGEVDSMGQSFVDLDQPLLSRSDY